MAEQVLTAEQVKRMGDDMLRRLMAAPRNAHDYPQDARREFHPGGYLAGLCDAEEEDVD